MGSFEKEESCTSKILPYQPGKWLKDLSEEFNQLEKKYSEMDSQEDDFLKQVLEDYESSRKESSLVMFKRFDRLQQAIAEFWENPGKELKIFSKEINKNYRIFIVMSKVFIFKSERLSTQFFRSLFGSSTNC